MPDVPSFETCKRLAAAGWNQDPNGPTREWWIEPQFSTKWLGDHSDVVNLVGDPEVKFYAAPSIGQMLAEIKRQGWGMTLERKRQRKNSELKYWVSVNCEIGRWCGHFNDSPAEALALCLCDALEATKP